VKNVEEKCLIAALQTC